MFKGDNGPHVLVAKPISPPIREPVEGDPIVDSAEPNPSEPLEPGTAAVRVQEQSAGK